MITLELTKEDAALVAAACLVLASDEEAPADASATLTRVCDDLLAKIGRV